MDDLKKLDVNFVSRESVTTRKSRRMMVERADYSAQRGEEYTGSLLSIKIGICAVIFLLVLLLKLADTPLSQTVLKGIETAIDTEGDTVIDESLGKLKFVELPGLLTVFAGGDKLTAPIRCDKITLLENNMLKFYGKPGESVVVAGQGTVKAVGEDESYGAFVVVEHEGDIDTYYYGLMEISAEEGQPVKKLDTLGIVGESGIMYFALREAGQPRDPSEYINVSASRD